MLNAVGMIGIEPLLIILVIVLVLFGGKKIPELLRGVGRGVGELQKGLDEGKRQLNASLHDDPEPVQKSNPVEPPATSTTTETPATKKESVGPTS